MAARVKLIKKDRLVGGATKRPDATSTDEALAAYVS